MTQTLALYYTDSSYEIDLLSASTDGAIMVLKDGWAPASAEPDSEVKRNVRREVMRAKITGASQDIIARHISRVEQILELAALYDRSNGQEGVLVFLGAKWTNETYTRYCRVYDGRIVKPETWAGYRQQTVPYVAEVTLELVCEEYWLSDRPTPGGGSGAQYAKNLVRNPAFIEDGNSDGLADYWSKVGTSTTSFDTDLGLIVQAQRVESTTNGEGIASTSITGITAFQASCYLMIDTLTGGNLRFGVWNDTSGAWVAGAYNDIAPGAFTASTWTKYTWTATGLNSGHNFQIRAVTQASVSALDCYLDQAYLHSGLTNLPQFWASFHWVKNHIDSDVGDINYLIIADVPGDAPALVELQIKNMNAGDIGQIWIGMRSDMTDGAGQLVPSMYRDDFSGTADAACSGGAKLGLSSTTTQSWMTATTAARLQSTTGYSKLPELFSGPFRALLRLKANTGIKDNIELRIVDQGNSSDALHSNPNDAVTPDYDNQWTMVDLGPVWFPVRRQGYQAATAVGFNYAYQWRSNNGTSVGGNIDFAVMMPTQGYINIYNLVAKEWAGLEYLVLGNIPQREGVYTMNTSGVLVSSQSTYIGDVPAPAPTGAGYSSAALWLGQPKTKNVLVFAWQDTSGVHTFDEYLEITTRLVARYRSVRGAR
jgi:hypothetical protein